ncbi:hypothetical protein C0Q70_03111 [Pomacea canaliculata]|uniref:ZP domain-containing protein n=2 Tax=Pomacea canaliculata TaxID=400727 RepID=A0A2T7PRU3_POMCA|nr:hypothetical protein C0Q70_03111 [Pomacea canaliculata]
MATMMNFTCERPTTNCDLLYGDCDLHTGMCTCRSGAIGLMCQHPGGFTPCTKPCHHGGTCFVTGSGPRCACGDGYYGDSCEHPMATAECFSDKMWINIYPYGFQSALDWSAPSPEIPLANGSTCPLVHAGTKPSMQINLGWEGFVGEFLHANDSCAGDATVVWDNATSRGYSRLVKIAYSTVFETPTDQLVPVHCVIDKQHAAAAPKPSPVNFIITDTLSRPVKSPVKLGSQVNVTFRVDPNSNYLDLKVLFCMVTDTSLSEHVVVVDNSCAQPPFGLTLYSPGRGENVLMMTMYRFARSTDLHFQCKVHMCDILDRFCQQAPNCPVISPPAFQPPAPAFPQVATVLQQAAPAFPH